MKSFIRVILSVVFCMGLVEAQTKTYYGVIAEYPITMTLSFENNTTVVGEYFYNKWKNKIALRGQYKGEELILNAYDKDVKLSEYFEARLLKNKIAGIWKQKDLELNFEVYASKNTDPFEDQELSCFEMNKYKTKIFGSQYGVDLGSGHGSRLSVDYSCRKSVASLKFLENLLVFAEDIRSEGTSSLCTGSIVHAQWRYYHFDLLAAGLAPEIYSKDTWRYNELENMKKYFLFWGHQSLTNFKAYTSYWEEYEKVLPLLEKHYEKTFLVSQEKAKKYAQFALTRIFSRATGSFSSSLDKTSFEFTRLDSLLAKKTSSLEDIKVELAQKYSKKGISKALNIALLYENSQSLINLLLEQGTELNMNDESSLFFALNKIDNVSFLLKHGAQVNYANHFGKTVLYYAIQIQDLSLVKLLVENAADINHQYIDKETKENIWTLCSLKHTKRSPLMHAAQHADIQILKYLISQGAKTDAVDEIGFNVLDYAHMGKKDESIVYLESIGLKTKRTYW